MTTPGRVAARRRNSAQLPDAFTPLALVVPHGGKEKLVAHLSTASAQSIEADIDRMFERLSEEATHLRKEILQAAGPLFALNPHDQARANLEIARSIFGKWSIDILVFLFTERAARFSTLRRTLRGISSDALSRKLRLLEKFGLLERHVGSGHPPEVTYRLTKDGHTAARLGEPVFLFLRYRQRMQAQFRGRA